MQLRLIYSKKKKYERKDMVMRKRYKTKLFKIIGMVALSFVLVVMGLFPTKMVSAKVIGNDKTGIPDKNLYQAILFELGKKSDQKITEDDLEEVYSIGGYFIEKNRNKKVKNLKGLEKFKNLYRLEIPIKGSTSLKGIDKIPNLEKLAIKNAKLKNFNELIKLHKLTQLTMSNMTVKDWSGIRKLTELTSLEIDKCNLKNFKQISRLTNLEYLTIKNTKLKNLKGIGNLTKLTGLYVPNNCLSSVSGLEKLKQLWDFDASYNKLTKLPSLKKLKKLVLEHTSFSGNKISEKEFKKKLPSKVSNRWINYQVFQQNTKKKLKVNHVENINGNTKKITGVTEKQIKNVVLMTDEGEKIKTVKSNKKGKFSFKELDLSTYEGKKLKIVILRVFYDPVKDESGFDTLKTVKFKVQNSGK